MPGRKQKSKKKYELRRSLNTESGRTFFNYTEKDLHAALQRIRSEEGMSVLNASKTYGIPRTTLRRKLTQEQVTFGKTGRYSYLGMDVENELREWLLEMCRAGAPIPKAGLLFSVQYLCKENDLATPFKDGIPGFKWFRNFMNRHPVLTLKKSEYLSKARAKVTEPFIRNWFMETRNLVGEDIYILMDILMDGADRNRVWNMDETAVFINPGKGLVIGERGKCCGKVGENDKENLTCLVCVNAAGEIATPLAVFGYKRIPESVLNKMPENWCYGKSDTGWMTSEVFYEFICNGFYPYLKEKGTKFPVIIFLDGHVSHLSLPLSYFCAEHGIIVICLPPNCTHVLQVLDVVVFGPLKIKWSRLKDLFRLKTGREIQKDDTPRLLQELFDENDFTNTIKNGFTKCGLFPFNENNVDYTKLVTTPIPESPENPTSAPAVTENDDFASALRIMESRMPPGVLQDFYCSSSTRTDFPDVKFQGLFEVWKDLYYKVHPLPPASQDFDDDAFMNDLDFAVSELGNVDFNHVKDFRDKNCPAVGNSEFGESSATSSEFVPEPIVENLEEIESPAAGDSGSDLGPASANKDLESLENPVVENSHSVQQPTIQNSGLDGLEPADVRVRSAESTDKTLLESATNTSPTIRSRASSEPRRMSVHDMLNDYNHFPAKQLLFKKKNRSIQHLPTVMTNPLWQKMKEEAAVLKMEKEAQKEAAKLKKVMKESEKEKKKEAAAEKKRTAALKKKKESEDNTDAEADPIHTRSPFKEIGNTRRSSKRNTVKKNAPAPTSRNKRPKIRKNNDKKEEENPACAVCLERFLSRPGVEWVQCIRCEAWCHDECSTRSICDNCFLE